jgi:hypothetical protein
METNQEQATHDRHPADRVLRLSYDRLSSEIRGRENELEEIEKRAIQLREHIDESKKKREEVGAALRRRQPRVACDNTASDGEIVACGATRLTVTVDGESTNVHILTGVPGAQLVSRIDRAIGALTAERNRIVHGHEFLDGYTRISED